MKRKIEIISFVLIITLVLTNLFLFIYNRFANELPYDIQKANIMELVKELIVMLLALFFVTVLILTFFRKDLKTSFSKLTLLLLCIIFLNGTIPLPIDWLIYKNLIYILSVFTLIIIQIRIIYLKIKKDELIADNVVFLFLVSITFISFFMWRMSVNKPLEILRFGYYAQVCDKLTISKNLLTQSNEQKLALVQNNKKEIIEILKPINYIIKEINYKIESESSSLNNHREFEKYKEIQFNYYNNLFDVFYFNYDERYLNKRIKEIRNKLLLLNLNQKTTQQILELTTIELPKNIKDKGFTWSDSFDDYTLTSISNLINIQINFLTAESILLDDLLQKENQELSKKINQ